MSAGSFIGGELLIDGGNVLLSGSLSVMGGDGGNGIWASGSFCPLSAKPHGFLKHEQVLKKVGKLNDLPDGPCLGPPR